MKNWKKDILTIPNLLSLLRLILIPVYISIYMGATQPKQFHTAGLILVLSCLTDLADGKIARHFNMISTLGKILDPLADKLTQFALTVCLSLRYPMLIPVLILFVIKEIFQLTLGFFYLINGKMLTGALPAGKICTTILFISLTALVLFPTLPPPVPDFIAAADMVFLMISFIQYILAYWGRNPLIRDLNME